jgi:hypothetical protein
MRVTIYDKNPGPGFMQWFLKTSWLVGCLFQKFVGAVDDYYGATSWDDAKDWLMKQKTPLKVVQYWGHGSPGIVWLSGNQIMTSDWLSLKPLLSSDSLLWFRVCNSFQGAAGQGFSRKLADGLNCTIAGHTRVIGLFQGGLYTRTPRSIPSWDIAEGTGKPSFIGEEITPWNKHTIFCLRTSIPKGW